MLGYERENESGILRRLGLNFVSNILHVLA
jgi:hypothetical protein